MIAAARSAGITPKAKTPWKAAVGVCIGHVDVEALGFLSLSDLVLYVGSLARRGPKLRKIVQFPRVKCPPGVIKVLAVRCPHCRAGTHCATCDGWQWGFRFFYGRRDPKCPNHGSA